MSSSENRYQRVEISAGHYGIVLRDQRAVAFLRPGLHRVWAVDRRIEVRVYPSTEAILDGDLTPELRATVHAESCRRACVGGCQA